MKGKTIITLILLTVFSVASFAQTKTYYSSNKSFSVSVPTSYSLYKQALPNYISFTSEKQHGVISVKREFVMTDQAFAKYVSEQKSSKPSKYRCIKVTESPNFYHYKFAAGLFVTHEFYMRKIIDGYSYVILADGISMTEAQAKAILESVTAY